MKHLTKNKPTKKYTIKVGEPQYWELDRKLFKERLTFLNPKPTKKIEKMEVKTYWPRLDEVDFVHEICRQVAMTQNKLNEIIDYLNET